jgi:hypothetical protein
VLTAVEGIYKDGEVELLERPEGLRKARVIVTFLPTAPAESSAGEARNRLLSRMKAGIDLGGPPYPTRPRTLEKLPTHDHGCVTTKVTPPHGIT